ncbi:hypothetical protein [uncultured Sphingomonas sp.]|uniref:hypothetical protein n=1 Tax=uncultured Sphingomonas sp. TaxID=158754 RepID=UPI0035CC683C
MRISSALAVPLLLAGCGKPAADSATLERVEADAGAAAADNGRIECAVANAPAFARDCTIERQTGDAGLVLTVRAPNGGFHRLLVTKDGRGVVSADGAEPARVTIVGADRIEVAIGGDRYRLPATVKGKPAK